MLVEHDSCDSGQIMVITCESNGSATISVLQRFSTSRSTGIIMDMYKDVHEHFDGVKIKFCSVGRSAIAACVWCRLGQVGNVHFLKKNCCLKSSFFGDFCREKI